MKKYQKKIAVFCAVMLIVCGVTPAFAEENVQISQTVNIAVDTSAERKEISPYIFGINSELMEKGVTANAIRVGGNRLSGYNWETNASNAGSDWSHCSDNYLVSSLTAEEQNTPGAVALNLNKVCREMGNAYPLMTLQMAGFVSADMNGAVSDNEAAPSERWKEVVFAKESDFSLAPDTSDNYVYMDEFVNYLVNTLGDSQNGGIRGYSLDNEPSLWKHTHALMHPEATSCEEIITKSISLSKAVKAVDENAEIFGPALFGYSAFDSFAGAPDWQLIKSQNSDYRWFIDYYLDEMKKAEDECGKRLLDVLDIHFYTEAKGECGERSCQHFDREGCVTARLNSTRSLWDESYSEDSWITDTGAEFFPILPNLQASIDKFYPGTKLAITEYDFGGGYDISGAIAQADALGVFAQNEVYMATLFAGDSPFNCAAINLYTNYDGKGHGFGDTLVSCKSDNIELSTAYASVFGESNDVITLVLTNKSFTSPFTANISLGDNYGYAEVYGIHNVTAEIKLLGTSESGEVNLSADSASLEMESESVCMLVIGKDKNDVLNLASRQETAEENVNNVLPSSDTSKSEAQTANKDLNVKAVPVAILSLVVLSLGFIYLVKSRNNVNFRNEKDND